METEGSCSLRDQEESFEEIHAEQNFGVTFSGDVKYSNDEGDEEEEKEKERSIDYESMTLEEIKERRRKLSSVSLN